MTKKASVVLAALIGLAGWAEARSDPITCTVKGTASGSLGGTPFTDASVTVTATADTSMVMNLGSGLFQVSSLSASVSVTGLGTAAFTIPTRTFDNQPVP